MPMRVSITGGLGFIGGRLGQHLQHAGHQVVLGTRRLCNPPDWLPQAEVVPTEWDDAIGLEPICERVDVVIHAAGINAQDCAADPVSALEFNGLATARLAKVAAEKGVKRFVFLSTAHVYASPLVGTITESTCPRNPHPYATSHRAGEDAVLYTMQLVGIEAIVVRLSNAFGAPVHRDVNCWTLLVNDLCRQAVITRKLVLHSAGFQKRDFITLLDVSRAIEHFISLPADQCKDGLFNLGGECVLRIIDMAELIAERCYNVFGFRPEIIIPKTGTQESTSVLEYRIDKLKSTEFTLNKNTNAEIDATLLFCQNEFSKKSVTHHE